MKQSSGESRRENANAYLLFEIRIGIWCFWPASRSERRLVPLAGIEHLSKLLHFSRSEKQEGAGNAGCTLHPRSRVH